MGLCCSAGLRVCSEISEEHSTRGLRSLGKQHVCVSLYRTLSLPREGLSRDANRGPRGQAQDYSPALDLGGLLSPQLQPRETETALWAQVLSGHAWGVGVRLPTRFLPRGHLSQRTYGLASSTASALSDASLQQQQ